MRRLISLLALIALLGSCGKQDTGYTIQVELGGIEGHWVQLLAREGREYVVVDSVLAVDGAPAVISGKVDGVRTMYLGVEGMNGSVRLLMDNGLYEISGSLGDPVIMTDSKAQTDLNDYNQGKVPILSEMSSLREQIIRIRDTDRDKADSLRIRLYLLQDEEASYDSLYVKAHPASFASVLALRGYFYMLDNTELETTLSSLAPPLHQMEEYRYMKGKLDRMNAVAVGKPFIDFGMETPEGNILRVSDVQHGDVLLIDFWASWCGPCRRANPELVEIYQEFHDRGFQILGVSLDRDSARWVNAIADDHLTWSHISDLKYWDSEGAELYGVSAIPHSVLISREGIIMANDLSGQELKDAIEALL